MFVFKYLMRRTRFCRAKHRPSFSKLFMCHFVHSFPEDQSFPEMSEDFANALIGGNARKQCHMVAEYGGSVTANVFWHLERTSLTCMSQICSSPATTLALPYYAKLYHLNLHNTSRKMWQLHLKGSSCLHFCCTFGAIIATAWSTWSDWLHRWMLYGPRAFTRALGDLLGADDLQCIVCRDCTKPTTGLSFDICILRQHHVRCPFDY
jgi:hypothetical protein